ncbi:3-oxo-5-alpha-steroid 4-dehydrogenase-domain-containing protein [Hygrophoropsis aurantiaca]|uniref:3-oxo-5-alpha-steroid 4-dehydrogenase-domain-containing protein n=1 Tax=Hygrophoropsis aurantiaca TaxID=72124 RepID=A0ACB8A0G0_9AGAM|nr:3-oxo-5-alpha-steroid 4-dehydrogenase-domain-containing protein [Hygrophoropsis aurantiaca]
MNNVQAIYDTVRKWFFIIPPIVCPVQFLINAPFGRFAPSNDSIMVVDGIKSWIIMELVSPITFVYTILKSPLSKNASHLSGPQIFLASLFLIHYLNRALISPLRTPSRSKSHIIVPLSAVSFNLVNGALMGAYISSPAATTFLAEAFERPLFWVGISLWSAGLVGNILHDEILLNIRRNAKAKGKGKSDDHGDKQPKEHYAIPHGYLYSYISYPNYFCEWIEWLGFALAAAPMPPLTSFAAVMNDIQPPWLFFLSEVLLMISRAYKGHKWYHQKFPGYPKERKAVIPFIF